MSEAREAEGTNPGASRRVAYLVLSHGRPERVESLAARILELSPNGVVVVHHDAGEAREPWAGSPPGRAELVERMPVRWGDWSVVEASLRMLRHARDVLDADWYVFLSGDDRPVVDLARWEQSDLTPELDGIVPARPLTTRPTFGRRPTPDDLNYARYAYRWRALPEARGPVLRHSFEGARRVSRYAQPLFKIEYAGRRDRFFLGLPRRRRLPAGWTLYTGAQWLALGRRAAEAVARVEQSVVDWYRETWIPDQSFFHTVVYNQPGLTLRNATITYVPPQRLRSTRPDWMVLRVEDLEEIRRAGTPFARKFDAGIDAEIGRLVDAAVDAAVGAART
jgi:hypothetical protein